MKNQGLLFSIFTVLLILINKSYAQAPNIEWQNCLGGTSLEDFTKMKQSGKIWVLLPKEFVFKN